MFVVMFLLNVYLDDAGLDFQILFSDIYGCILLLIVLFCDLILVP